MLTLSSFMPPPISQTEEVFIYISEEMSDFSLNQIPPGLPRKTSGTFVTACPPLPSPWPRPFSASPSPALLGSQEPQPAAILIVFLQLNCFLISTHSLLLLFLIKFSISFLVYFSRVFWLARGKENTEVAELWGQAGKAR